jgi:hypothetical protein
LRQALVAGLISSASAAGLADSGAQLAALGAGDRLTTLSELMSRLPPHEQVAYATLDQNPEAVPGAAPGAVKRRTPIQVRIGYDRGPDEHLLFAPEPLCGSLQPNSRLQEPATVMRFRFNRSILP